ncbi:hypothetical protein [Williamwhitmania taraxaci]|uniref:Uncharacterized protein n=1 Tax=Williamwhitmania taraxaci TaxID=1640674 RepID=A0A1G6H8W6_9BACT|nr:hypothetical protein [Williamwhitmania taraxaci]SDB90395.1 hypothetical protein SAMN05216323_100819 [Williamwhitmania taraxaci]
MLHVGRVRIALITVLVVGVLCNRGMAQHYYETSEPPTIVADIMDNCYVVEGSRVSKLDSTLLLKSRYSSSYGAIAQIDASDPFKLLLFQKDFYRITFLDNALALLGESLFLPDAGANSPLLACNMADGGYWVFDGIQTKLLFYRSGPNSSFSSNDLSVLLGDVMPSQLQSSNGLVFLGIPNKGIAVFDKFGGYKHLIAIPEASENFVAQFGKIYFSDGNKDVCSVNATGLGDKHIVLKKTFDYQRFAVGKKYLFFVNGNRVFTSPFLDD